MSSSKVIYVNDDDMLGGMFNNETKPLVSAPEHKPTNTPMTTSQPVSVEQTDGGQQSIPVQETHIQPAIAQQPPMVPRQPAMIPQQSPSMVQQNQQPVMTGGTKENGDTSSESSSDSDEDEKNTPPLNTKPPDGNDNDSSSDTSSICTDQLLTFDPMYIKLTKFLYTSEPGNNNGRNITQVLEGIEKQMERLATALVNSTLMSASSVETSQDE